jgi:putative ATPase
MSDLWAAQRKTRRQEVEPLAIRMRPRSLDEVIGQPQMLGTGRLLRRMLDADRLTSVIFHGPPGTGKTTLAEVIALHTGCHFERAHAAQIGVKEIRVFLDQATRQLEDEQRRTILFLDEIHRFARNQQDVLLGDVEEGLITLIGATTENPYFAINSALVSRSTIFRFEPLDEAAITTIIRRAITDPRGFGHLDVRVHNDAVEHWATRCDGDARRALTALEVAVLSQIGDPARPPETITVDLACAEASIQTKALVYDGTGDEHYDVISAFIKSMRASNPDAAVYWLARMLEAGEDPRFIARRIAILASEDIGNADPAAIQVAAAAWEITERIGVPECQLPLAQAAIYMACAPKSNASARAIWDAVRDVREGRTIPVPEPLRGAHHPGAKSPGHGAGYVSPHEGGHRGTDAIDLGRSYYRPTDQGFEDLLRRRLEQEVGESEGRQSKEDVSDE